jgi:hypothetical protein
MKLFRIILEIFVLCILVLMINACNFPGLETAAETGDPSTESIEDTEPPPRPTQPSSASPTQVRDQPPTDQPESEPFAVAKGITNCYVAPFRDSEVARVMPQGEKAPVLGVTPNQNWIAVKLMESEKPCWLLVAEVEHNVNLGNLEVLEPPATSTPTLGSIAGILWHEICDYTGGHAGEPVVLGQGCVQWGAESWEFGPNQVKDVFEEGWEGVTLHLGPGPCPSTGLDTTITNVAGEYLFVGLSAGTYCVSYSNLSDGNDTILIPGGPTYPDRGDDGFFQTVVLNQGENSIGVDFGYAFQFYD